MTFREWIRSEKGLHELHRGLYGDVISNWLKYVQRDQLLVIEMSFLIKNTTQVLENVKEFLGMKKPFDPTFKGLPIPREVKKPAPQQGFDCLAASEVFRYYYHPNVNGVSLDQELFSLISNSTGKSKYEFPIKGFGENSMRGCLNISSPILGTPQEEKQLNEFLAKAKKFDSMKWDENEKTRLLTLLKK
jgi:hypothetical protein